tara:strand:- start:40480 stop:41208 length:729 start_codon:yes stop_codon:yes gene_type:complete
MATLRKLVSDIRSSHKLLSTDSLITDRAIASEIRNNSLFLIKRETNLRKLWATDTLFTTIPCLELCEVPLSECCNYVDDCTISRSKEKLPQISEGNYQYVIQGVYSINALGGKGTKFKETTVNRFINLLKLPIIKKEYYYWIANGYLYLSNPLLQAVRFVAFFEEDVPNDTLYPEDCDCGKQYTLEQICINPLDKEFPLPGYLEQPTLQLTSQKLLSTYFAIKTDISQDGVDGQAPNSKPTN